MPAARTSRRYLAVICGHVDACSVTCETWTRQWHGAQHELPHGVAYAAVLPRDILILLHPLGSRIDLTVNHGEGAVPHEPREEVGLHCRSRPRIENRNSGNPAEAAGHHKAFSQDIGPSARRWSEYRKGKKDALAKLAGAKPSIALSSPNHPDSLLHIPAIFLALTLAPPACVAPATPHCCRNVVHRAC